MIARRTAPYRLAPIDDAARNGRFQLVTGGREFAVVRWTGNGWAFSSGIPLTFEPIEYKTSASHG